MRILRRAFADTFSGIWKPGIGGAFGFAITFLLVIRDSGWDAAMAEAELWIFSVIGSVGALLLIFMWNLACAPYRIERDKRVSIEARLEAMETKRSVGLSLPFIPSWSAWKVRSRFTILEAAYLLADLDPRQAPAEGPVLAHLKEMAWAVQDGKLQTIWTKPEALTSVIMLLDHQGKLKGKLGPREVSEDEMIEAGVFRAYLAARSDEPARKTLTNLGGADLVQSLPKPGA